MKTSKFLKLNWKDALKGFAVAFAMAILTAFYTAISNNQFPITWDDWRLILISGLGAGIAYLLKNLFTNSEGSILKKENE